MKNLKNKQQADERRNKKNMRVEMEALDDKDVIFGKTIKAMGGGMFRVAVPQPEHPSELIEVTAKAVDKNMARIYVNDVVIVVLSGRVYELKGNVSSGNVKLLAKNKRIHPALIESGGQDDGGIEFEVEKTDVAEGDDGELDISAI